MIVNREAEIGVIGCCLLGGLTTTLQAVESLPPSAFTSADCSEAWAVLEMMANQGKRIDLPSFAREWPLLCKVKIPDEIINAINKVPSAENLPYYSELLDDCTKRRRVETAGDLLKRKAGDLSKSIQDLMAEADNILLGEHGADHATIDGPQASQELTNYLEETYHLHQTGKRSGIETGFRYLDHLTDGLQRGELSLIAARPSIGKSAIGLNIALHACIRNAIPTVFVTLEMSRRSLLRRMCASWTGIPLRELKTGEYIDNTPQAAKVVAFFGALSKSKMLIHDAVSGIDASRLCATIRRLVKTHGVQLVIVDYLQKIKAPEKHEKRTYEVAQVSGALKGIAVATNTAVLTLAQLNRKPEEDKDRVPKLTDLADSGQIERDADMVALLHRKRDAVGIHKASLIVAKQRDGELGCVNLEFNPGICLFQNPGPDTTPERNTPYPED